jgi:pimeloyl-ACP methyl ester carboxylesterase
MVYSRFRMVALILMCVIAISTITETAQSASEEATEEPDVNSVVITIEATDGLTLEGEFFRAEPSDGRVVFLLHELYTTRASWYPYIEAIRAAGFHVLAVDVRGFGRTRGRINWQRAQEDTQKWLDWLYLEAGIRGDAVFLVGSSMGSSLALVGCAEAPACSGSVAISPGRNYFGVSTDDAIVSGKPMLLVYADRDLYPRRAVPYMQEQEGFNGEVITYSGRAHGMLLLANEEDLLPQIIGWMNARL